MFRLILVALLTSFMSSVAYSETVTESWLRQAGISCGGGLSVGVQGEIDAALIRRLKLVKVDADGVFQMSETEDLLKQFQKEEKRSVYKDYVTCLLTLMQMAKDTSQLPDREVKLDSSIAVYPLEIVKRGQRFVMKPGDSFAIENHSTIFSLNSVPKENPDNPALYFSWSNSETGKGEANTYVFQSQPIKIDAKCVLVPYKVEIEHSRVSFISNC